MTERRAHLRGHSQGEDESIVYTVTTTEWGSAPTGVVVTAYEVVGHDKTDVSATVLTGASAVAGDVITLPALASLTAGEMYRVEVQFDTGGNTFECYFYVTGEQ